MPTLHLFCITPYSVRWITIHPRARALVLSLPPLSLSLLSLRSLSVLLRHKLFWGQGLPLRCPLTYSQTLSLSLFVSFFFVLFAHCFPDPTPDRPEAPFFSFLSCEKRRPILQVTAVILLFFLFEKLARLTHTRYEFDYSSLLSNIRTYESTGPLAHSRSHPVASPALCLSLSNPHLSSFVHDPSLAFSLFLLALPGHSQGCSCTGLCGQGNRSRPVGR